MPVSIMTPGGPRTRVLVKANDELISHCTCENAIATSGQLDCPWCGCGWLFCCMDCRKAFTFAKCVIVNESLEDIVRRKWRGWYQEDLVGEELLEEVESTAAWLENTVVGRQYVYFDGVIVGVDEGGVRFEGLFAEHDLSFVPQVRALTEWSVREEVLENEAYWRERQLPEED